MEMEVMETEKNDSKEKSNQNSNTKKEIKQQQPTQKCLYATFIEELTQNVIRVNPEDQLKEAILKLNMDQLWNSSNSQGSLSNQDSLEKGKPKKIVEKRKFVLLGEKGKNMEGKGSIIKRGKSAQRYAQSELCMVQTKEEEKQEEVNQKKQQIQQSVKSLIQFGQTNLTQYKKLEALGKGTYGEVSKYQHIESGAIVAIKTFKFSNKENGINYSTLREIALLKKLKGHPSFVQIMDIIQENNLPEKPMHCVFEYCDTTLAKFILKYSNERKPIPEDKIRTIMKQLLEGISYLHSEMVFHRDLKPDNILMDSLGNVKIADFGLSKKISFLQRRKSTTIVSLWFRAPEVILGSENYFYGVDIWSIGCIFAELLTNKSLFSFSSENQVIDRIFQILGTPNPHFNSQMITLPKFQKLKFGCYFPVPSFSLVFPKVEDYEALDLLQQMLVLNHQGRITAYEALCHPYFQKMQKMDEYVSLTSRAEPKNFSKRKRSQPHQTIIE